MFKNQDFISFLPNNFILNLIIYLIRCLLFQIPDLHSKIVLIFFIVYSKFMSIKSLVLISDFVIVDHGKYIVKVSVYRDGIILGCALASGDTVEKAEDEARKRAITLVNSNISLEIPEKSIYIPKIELPSKIESEKKDLSSLPKKVKSTKPTPEVVPQDLISVSENMAYSPENELNMDINQDEIVADNFVDNDNSTEENIIETPLEFTFSEDNKTLNLSESKAILDSNDHSEDNSEDNSENNLILFPSSTSEDDSYSETTLPLPIDLSDTVDFSQIIDQTSIEMKRLGWTQDQGKKYLLETYGKKSRHLLSDNELIEFLNYLKTQ